MSNLNQDALGGTGAPAGQRPVVFMLTAGIAVIGANSLLLGPIAPEVALTFGAEVRGVMAAAAAYGLGTAAGALFLARFIDRVGARRMLSLALAVLTLALAASAAAPAVAALIAAQLLAGLAAGVALPAIYALAAAVAPPGRESETIGVVLTGWTLSMVAGVSLSTVIADLAHWRLVYAVLASLGLFGALVLGLGAVREAKAAGGLTPSPLQALALPGVARLLLVCAAYMVAFYGVYAYLGDHLHRVLGQPTSANGLVTLAYGLGFGGAAALDRVIDRVGPRRAMPAAYAGIAAVYLAMAPGSGSLAVLVALALLWGLLNHFGLNLLILRLGAIDPARRGTIMGLNSAVTYLAASAGTLGFGPLYSHGGLPLLAAVAAGLLALGAVLTAGGLLHRKG